MSFVTLKTTTTVATAAGATFTVPYAGQSQADFTSGSTAILSVYGRQFTGLAVTFGASAATVTWPAGAPYPLPADEYYVQFDLVGGDPLPGNVAQVTPVADSTAIDVAGIVADHNALLAAMRTAGLLAE